jgi:7,8-dihydropterin-6-yl-methyl-4-(beta-D-ribofuranosyl)aminobenzene 5'-phosphate synthase
MKFRILQLLISLFLFLDISGQEADQKIIILYDNNQFSENTISDWGFSCLVISGNDTILFDTGARKDIFFHNLEAMNVDLKTVHTLVVSHHHGDHAGNIFPVIENTGHIQVFLPSSLDGNFRQMVDQYNVHAEVDTDIRQIAHHVFLTGEMGFQIREQGLVIETSKGLVLIVGCAHPGVDRMLKKVVKKFNKPVYMVIGGFHMEEYSDPEIDHLIETFRDFEVKKIAPAHCTGKHATEKFMKAYQHNFIRCGTGKVVDL